MSFAKGNELGQRRPQFFGDEGHFLIVEVAAPTAIIESTKSSEESQDSPASTAKTPPRAAPSAWVHQLSAP